MLELTPPRQARTRASWDGVLDAGVEILVGGGYDALTIAAVCERAGVTPPTIYARAKGKYALLLAVYERAMERVEATEALLPDERPVSIRAAVGWVATIWLQNADLLRPIVHCSATDAEVARRGSVRSTELARRFREAV